MKGFLLSTDRTDSNVLLCDSLHGGLLTVSLEQRQGSPHTRVAGELGCVNTLQDLGMERIWRRQLAGLSPGSG